jgi:hypothetical protein
MNDASIQFSLRGLLIGVALCGFGIAALLSDNRFLESIVASSLALTWMAAIPCAIFLTGASRAFAIGFAIWGPLYLAIAVLAGDFAALSLGRTLITSQFLDWLFSLRPINPNEDGNWHPGTRVLESVTFIQCGQFLWTWILAICGGFLAKYVYLQSHRLRRQGSTTKG